MCTTSNSPTLYPSSNPSLTHLWWCDSIFDLHRPRLLSECPKGSAHCNAASAELVISWASLLLPNTTGTILHALTLLTALARRRIGTGRPHRSSRPTVSYCLRVQGRSVRWMLIVWCNTTVSAVAVVIKPHCPHSKQCGYCNLFVWTPKNTAFLIQCYSSGSAIGQNESSPVHIWSMKCHLTFTSKMLNCDFYWIGWM